MKRLDRLSASEQLPCTGDYDWDHFDARAYADRNYGRILRPDRWIARTLTSVWPAVAERLGRDTIAIDVGTGPNLYPAMAALPFIGRLQLIEYSASNRRYLLEQLNELEPPWGSWADLFASCAPTVYKPSDIRHALADRVTVSAGDVRRLPPAIADVAQMFFCAEGSTDDEGEFIRACQGLGRSVRPGGSVIAAFMIGSSGYSAGRSFPGFPADEATIRRAFTGLCDLDWVAPVPHGHEVREGYEGMLLVVGTRTVTPVEEAKSG